MFKVFMMDKRMLFSIYLWIIWYDKYEPSDIRNLIPLKGWLNPIISEAQSQMNKPYYDVFISSRSTVIAS